MKQRLKNLLHEIANIESGTTGFFGLQDPFLVYTLGGGYQLWAAALAFIRDETGARTTHACVLEYIPESNDLSPWPLNFMYINGLPGESEDWQFIAEEDLPISLVDFKNDLLPIILPSLACSVGGQAGRKVYYPQKFSTVSSVPDEILKAARRDGYIQSGRLVRFYLDVELVETHLDPLIFAWIAKDYQTPGGIKFRHHSEGRFEILE